MRQNGKSTADPIKMANGRNQNLHLTMVDREKARSAKDTLLGLLEFGYLQRSDTSELSFRSRRNA